MTEEQVISWIHSTERFGSVLGLASITELLRRLGNPQKKLKIIHVAGTNGKGSVCAALAAILTAQGYRTGLYTSPYIEEFRERICIGNQMISPADLAKCGERVKQCCDGMERDGLAYPTEFELVTAIGFLYFEQSQCDFVVLEVGLGGRLDATNVIDPPLLSVITSIDFDHVDRLGHTLREIAFEKCGIIKPGSVAVTSPGQTDEALRVIREVTAERKVPLSVSPMPEQICADLSGTAFTWKGQAYRSALLGGHQAINAACCLQGIEALRANGVTVSDEAVRLGLSRVRHKARMELIRPNFILDGGHNLSGVTALCDFIRHIRGDRKIVIVAGMLRDKDYRSCGSMLRREADVLIATQTDSPRRLPMEEFAAAAQADECFENPVDAAQRALALAGKSGLAVACGSFTTVGPIRSKYCR